jgi:hypothetical protein
VFNFYSIYSAGVSTTTTGFALISWSLGSYQNWSATTSSAHGVQNNGAPTSKVCPCSTI